MEARDRKRLATFVDKVLPGVDREVEFTEVLLRWRCGLEEEGKLLLPKPGRTQR